MYSSSGLDINISLAFMSFVKCVVMIVLTSLSRSQINKSKFKPFEREAFQKKKIDFKM